jgi:hypothetical protein
MEEEGSNGQINSTDNPRAAQLVFSQLKYKKIK